MGLKLVLTHWKEKGEIGRCEEGVGERVLFGLSSLTLYSNYCSPSLFKYRQSKIDSRNDQSSVGFRYL